MASEFKAYLQTVGMYLTDAYAKTSCFAITNAKVLSKSFSTNYIYCVREEKLNCWKCQEGFESMSDAIKAYEEAKFPTNSIASYVGVYNIWPQLFISNIIAWKLQPIINLKSRKN